MVRVEKVFGKVKVAMNSILKNSVLENVRDRLLVRREHDVNLLSLEVGNLSSLVRVEGSLILVILKQVVPALPELPVGHEVGLACRVGNLDSLPGVKLSGWRRDGNEISFSGDFVDKRRNSRDRSVNINFVCA